MGTNHNSIGIKVCHECQSQIKDDEPYLCFKIPAKTDWILFHNRRPGSDCWETYLRKQQTIRVMEITARELRNPGGL
jgi:hypothetical protein